MQDSISLALGDLGNIRGTSIRYLSSYVKEKGIDTKLIFPLILSRGFEHLPRFTSSQKELVLRFLIENNITHYGCYLMTGHFRAFQELVTFLRQSGWQGCIIAGGIHASVCPEETLCEGVDFVVMGPGEESLVRIIRNEPLTDISGLVYRAEGGIIKNPISDDAYLDLDLLPFPDYDFDNHYVIRSTKMEQMTAKIYKELSGWGGTYYYLTTSRGCPYNCTYCCNFERKKLRRASVDRVIEELKYAKNKLPFLQGINIQDDSFFMGSDEWLEEFCLRIKADFGWQHIARIMPKFASEKRLKFLRDGGLKYVSIGLQGSERLNHEFYGRKETNDSFVKSCLTMYKLGIFYAVDVILDVVYETEADLREVARTLNRLPRPFKVLAYGMTPFPGSIFYEKVKEDGLLDKFGADAYESMFQATRPGAYKTPPYWRYLIQNIIPLKGGKEIERLIEAGPSDPAAAKRVKSLAKWNLRKMRFVEWGRQHIPFIFEKSMTIYNFLRQKLRT